MEQLLGSQPLRNVIDREKVLEAIWQNKLKSQNLLQLVEDDGKIDVARDGLRELSQDKSRLEEGLRALESGQSATNRLDMGKAVSVFTSTAITAFRVHRSWNRSYSSGSAFRR